jgi:hypothetical protein
MVRCLCHIHMCAQLQVMLEEAVAIVMSPRDSKNRRCGIFRLTTPGGMDLIKDCSQTGFHTHPPTSTGQKIYELCGHVRPFPLQCLADRATLCPEGAAPSCASTNGCISTAWLYMDGVLSPKACSRFCRCMSTPGSRTRSWICVDARIAYAATLVL